MLIQMPDTKGNASLVETTKREQKFTVHIVQVWSWTTMSHLTQKQRKMGKSQLLSDEQKEAI